MMKGPSSSRRAPRPRALAALVAALGMTLSACAAQGADEPIAGTAVTSPADPATARESAIPQGDAPTAAVPTTNDESTQGSDVPKATVTPGGARVPTVSPSWTSLPGVRMAAVPARADGAGHVVVGVAGQDGEELRALAVSDLRTEWVAPFSASCGYEVMPGATILAPLGVDGRGVLQVGASVVDLLDRAPSIIHDDPNTLPLPAGGWPCDTVVVVGDGNDAVFVGGATRGAEPLLFWAGEKQFAVDDLADVAFAEMPVPGLIAGPVVAGDGGAWVVIAVDDALTAARFDPVTEALVDHIPLPGTSLVSGPVATDGGFVVSLADDAGGSMVRVAGAAVAWRTPFPVAVDGRSHVLPERLVVDGETVAGYGGTDIVVLAAADGSVRGSVPGSSNAAAVALHDGAIVTGSPSGENWVEAYDAADLSLRWAAKAPEGTSAGDVRQIDSLGEDGVVVQSSWDGPDGIVVGLITLR